MIKLRAQQSLADCADIIALNKLAFPDTGGAAAFRTLRKSNSQKLSLLAVEDTALVGHILFLPAAVPHEGSLLAGMGLAELAVTPAYQRQGIGGQLINAGLQHLSAENCPFVLVVGHASYYPAFGFRPGQAHNLSCQWPSVPEESFMVKILDHKLMSEVSGIAAYTDKF